MAPLADSSQDCVQRITAGAIAGASIASFIVGILLSLLAFFIRTRLRGHTRRSSKLLKVPRGKAPLKSEIGHPRVVRKLSEEGWSWREKKHSSNLFTDLDVQDSPGSLSSDHTSFYAHTPSGTRGSAPSLPLPALLKERGLGIQIGTLSKPPSYQNFMYTADSPGSLYSQASATTFQHRRVTVPSDSTLLLTDSRHDLSARRSRSHARISEPTSTSTSPEDTPPLSTTRIRKRADSNPVLAPKRPRADSDGNGNDGNKRDQQVQTITKPLSII